MKSVYELCLEYYPRMWDETRLEQLVDAGKITEQEKDEIIEKNS